MTLGGLALAVGNIDEGRLVEVSTQLLSITTSHAVRQATANGRAVPGSAVHPRGVHPVVLHGGRTRVFVPLSLAVGYAMIASFSPARSCGALRVAPEAGAAHAEERPARVLRTAYESTQRSSRGACTGGGLLYRCATAAGKPRCCTISLGTSIFRRRIKRQFVLRLKAPRTVSGPRNWPKKHRLIGKNSVRTT